MEVSAVEQTLAGLCPSLMLVVAVQVSASRSLVLFLLICSWDLLLLELSLKDYWWSAVKGEDEALLRKYDSDAAKKVLKIIS
jgi:hypothetical protein